MWKPTAPSQNPVPPPEHVPASRSGSLTAPAADGKGPVYSHDRTLIGKSLMIKGQISGSESLHVDGRIEGSISVPDGLVVIGRGATIIADIIAGEVTVSGELRGKITVTDRVELRNNASVLGDVLAKRISIEEGAVFKGKIDLCRKDDKREGVLESDSVARPDADHGAVSDETLVASGAGAD
jgi:cytoskeletal protein CcmA (bactofilin family)